MFWGEVGALQSSASKLPLVNTNVCHRAETCLFSLATLCRESQGLTSVWLFPHCSGPWKSTPRVVHFPFCVLSRAQGTLFRWCLAAGDLGSVTCDRVVMAIFAATYSMRNTRCTPATKIRLARGSLLETFVLFKRNVSWIRLFAVSPCFLLCNVFSPRFRRRPTS